MAKYVIYDNKSVVYTPSGKKYSAEEWLNKYPWATETKMVVSGSVINGALAFVYDDFIDLMKKKGVDFTECSSDEECLAAIEAFEDLQSTTVMNDNSIDTQERIANALEDLVVMNMMSVEEETSTDTTSEEEVETN